MAPSNLSFFYKRDRDIVMAGRKCYRSKISHRSGSFRSCSRRIPENGNDIVIKNTRKSSTECQKIKYRTPCPSSRAKKSYEIFLTSLAHYFCNGGVINKEVPVASKEGLDLERLSSWIPVVQYHVQIITVRSLHRCISGRLSNAQDGLLPSSVFLL